MPLDLSLGFSPCPNDTFVFHALAHGEVSDPELTFTPVLADVETLNQRALRGDIDVTKISYGALPFLLDDYILLRSGGALGRGCGPLVVARQPARPERLTDLRIAIPGRLTTANLLLGLHSPGAVHKVEMEYNRIMPAVMAGEVDAGLIIHESRFTYADYGLLQVVDLGAWWEEETGLPIPLGAIVARRSLGEDRVALVDSLIEASVRLAFADPERSAHYVARHAQELSAEVRRRHIDLYVNEFTTDLGQAGVTAVRELLRRAAAAGLAPARDAVISGSGGLVGRAVFG